MKQYYRKNYQAYFEKTVSINPALFLEPFVRKLSQGSVVWDIGCGAGRDLLWLRQRGLNPVGFEQSSGLAHLAREYSGCRVVEGDFEIFDFSTAAAHGMLLTAALVHIEPHAVEQVLANILTGLKKGGIVHISMKQGEGIITDETGRIFYLWQPEVLESIFQKSGLNILEGFMGASALNTGETWLSYLLRFP